MMLRSLFPVAKDPAASVYAFNKLPPEVSMHFSAISAPSVLNLFSKRRPKL